MNKKFIIAIVGVIVVVIVAGATGFILLNKNNSQSPIIPEAKTLEPEKASDVSDECEAACGKYVMVCLATDPSVKITEDFFANDFNSCLQKCAKWSAEKTECMITAPNCEAFTDKCGL